eukprot:CAMPEP_0197635420 /NCGR_PEP_ID=MMETSP1338-20131121/11241_1 /TAXON_ID=43686 ORGANISM="Pelagodinium beii, Strain RCC1491" /NCGR_SAMPLE_ID=MMETSP1338 /ASSEMBLY_ACC=CAM_ASM_000754 /LENGTH=84 /DNA_ID=CAMNT_0043207465 /DNA_START=273 /DNA_END=527 /DNA_ORIENTATION=+
MDLKTSTVDLPFFLPDDRLAGASCTGSGKNGTASWSLFGRDGKSPACARDLTSSAFRIASFRNLMASLRFSSRAQSVGLRFDLV